MLANKVSACTLQLVRGWIFFGCSLRKVHACMTIELQLCQPGPTVSTGGIWPLLTLSFVYNECSPIVRP